MLSVAGKAAAHTPALLSVIFSSDHCRQRLAGKCGSLGRPCCIKNGKIAEEIGLDDGVTALQQLGLIRAV